LVTRKTTTESAASAATMRRRDLSFIGTRRKAWREVRVG